MLEVAEFNLEQELEGLVDMFSVQCINHKVEIFLDLSGITKLYIIFHFTAKELKKTNSMSLMFNPFSRCQWTLHYFTDADDIPKLIQGDSGRVVQIFANLISNSIKFTTCTSPFSFLCVKIVQ